MNINKRGYTLIELLAALTIVSLLAALAIPSLLSQRNKAKEAAAVLQVGALLRLSQIFVTENSRFPSTFQELGTAPRAGTYRFSLQQDMGGEGAFAAVVAASRDNTLRSFVGIVGVPNVVSSNRNYFEVTDIETLLCRSRHPKKYVAPYLLRDINTPTFKCSRLPGEWDEYPAPR